MEIADLLPGPDAVLASVKASGKKKTELKDVFAKRKDQIAHMIRERKTLAFLKEKAVYTEAAA